MKAAKVGSSWLQEHRIRKLGHSKRLLMKSLDSPGARTSVPHGADCNQLSPSKFTSITDSFLRKNPEMANIGSKTRADLELANTLTSHMTEAVALRKCTGDDVFNRKTDEGGDESLVETQIGSSRSVASSYAQSPITAGGGRRLRIHWHSSRVPGSQHVRTLTCRHFFPEWEPHADYEVVTCAVLTQPLSLSRAAAAADAAARLSVKHQVSLETNGKGRDGKGAGAGALGQTLLDVHTGPDVSQGAKLNPGWVRNVDKQSLLWLRYRKSTEGET